MDITIEYFFKVEGNCSPEGGAVDIRQLVVVWPTNKVTIQSSTTNITIMPLNS